MTAPSPHCQPDIVERLRDRDAVVISGLFHAIPTMREAADEIIRLRLELIASKPLYSRQLESRIEELTKALEQIAGLGEDDDDPEYEIARRALAPSLEQSGSGK